MVKSPFLVVPEFISPMMCEDLLDDVNFNVPDMNASGGIIQTSKTCERAELILFDRIQNVIAQMEHYYGVQYRGTERIEFQWFAAGSSRKPLADNSMFINGKWARTNARDLTLTVFLSDYQDNIPFDGQFEVYGGKLEYPQHQFGFNSQRGTLIIHPSDPHFINSVSTIMAGNLFLARTYITCASPLMYDPNQYPGNYTSWFI